MDAIVARSIAIAGMELTASAASEGTDKVSERRHMQPAMLRAFTSQLGERVSSEVKLLFPDFNGIVGRNVGGIDLGAKHEVDDGWSAFVELKWCPADGKYLGWAIWDIYKMMSGRVAPGADACYVIAGGPDKLWAKSDTVGDLFRSGKWSTEEVFRRYEPIFANGEDCKKLTWLASRFETALVADTRLAVPLDEWHIKAIRIEPDTTAWIRLVDGRAPAC